MIFFTSDQHFHHANILEYTGRPFETIEEMNEKLVKKWNEIVGKDDIVWNLGDFCLSNKEKTKEIFEKLNGHKYLIMGNHDSQRSKKWWREIGFESVDNSDIELHDNYLQIFMIHDPLVIEWATNDPAFDNSLILYGHVHEKEKRWKNSKNMIHVGVDAWNYSPVSLQTILKMQIQ